MNRIILQDEDKRVIIPIKEIDKLFHGKIVIHFAHGIPMKTEINMVEDVKIS